TQPEAAANIQIDKWIIFSIGAMLDFPGAEALARDPSLSAQLRAKNRRHFATPGPAHHGAVFPHRQCGSGSARELSSDIRDGLKDWLQGMVPGCNELFQG
ncbi:MAG: hypothetical protein WB566_00185, partial [Terriglobales bacterium]